MNLNNNVNIIEQLYENFINNYKETVSSFTAAEKREFAKFSSSFFNKWYFSSLFDDSIFSPSNIINSVCHCGESSVNSARLVKNGSGFNIIYVSDTLENHSFINDLKAFCTCFEPAGVFEKNAPPQNYADNIQNMDPFYWNYLFALAENNGLIKRMLSINTNKYQTDPSALSSFFSMDNTEMLRRLFDSAVGIFVNEFYKSSHVQENIVSWETVMDFLCNAASVDELFESILTSLGFNLENIPRQNKCNENSEEAEMIMTSAYFLGSLISQWLLMPLGAYMKLITPLYTMPFDFEAEADYIRPFLLTGCDISSELFSPCNFFALTSIGEKVLNAKNKNSVFSSLNEIFSQKQINALTLSYLKMNKIKSTKSPDANKKLYKLKVFYKNDRNKWKIIAAEEKTTLESIYIHTLSFFGIETSNKYAFYLMNKGNNSKTAVRINNPVKFRIDNVNWLTDNLLLKHSNDKSSDLIFTATKSGSSRKNMAEPTLIRQSREITFEERC